MYTQCLLLVDIGPHDCLDDFLDANRYSVATSAATIVLSTQLSPTTDRGLSQATGRIDRGVTATQRYWGAGSPFLIEPRRRGLRDGHS